MRVTDCTGGRHVERNAHANRREVTICGAKVRNQLIITSFASVRIWGQACVFCTRGELVCESAHFLARFSTVRVARLAMRGRQRRDAQARARELLVLRQLTLGRLGCCPTQTTFTSSGRGIYGITGTSGLPSNRTIPTTCAFLTTAVRNARQAAKVVETTNATQVILSYICSMACPRWHSTKAQC